VGFVVEIAIKVFAVIGVFCVVGALVFSYVAIFTSTFLDDGLIGESIDKSN